MKKYTVLDPIYRAHLLIWIGGDYKLLIKEFEKRNLPTDKISKESFGIYYFNGEYNILWMRKFDLIGFSHELMHDLMEIFDHRGIPTTNANQEAMAYYYQMMLENSLKKLGKFK